jgi:hypothetical protein
MILVLHRGLNPRLAKLTWKPTDPEGRLEATWMGSMQLFATNNYLQAFNILLCKVRLYSVYYSQQSVTVTSYRS